MRWTAIVNPAAGRGRTRRLVPKLSSALAALDVEVVVSTDADDPLRIGRAAAEAGRGIVACGGDGLAAVLAGVAADAGTPFAIVPTGAGNDLARSLGLHPRRPLDALAWIRGGREVPMDLGRTADDTGEQRTWFTTVANTGFDAEANRWANTVHRLSGTTLYLAAIARTLATYRPQRFRVSVDGGTSAEYGAWLVALANTPSYAGGMKIAPGARTDDGLLEVTVIGAVTRAVLVANLPRVATGSISKHPEVTTLTGRSFRVEAVGGDGPPAELWASGERVGPLPRTVEVVPGALRIMVPASS